MKNSKTLTGLLDFSVVAFIVFILMMMLFWSCKHEPIEPAVITEDNTGSGNGGGGNGGGGNGGGGSGNTGIPCDPDTAYFQNDILPLFISNCAKSGCHDAATHQEGFVFNSYSGIMGSGEIEAGDPSEGDIMEAITEDDPDKIMPPPSHNP